MGNNFEKNKKYNSENYVHLTLNIDKRCYSQGEYIKGTLFLIGKRGLIQTQLIDPTAKATLSEIQHYVYQEETQGGEGNETIERDEEEENIIFENRLCFSEYTGANLVSGVQIPFSIQVTNCYPSCIFSSRDYVKHFLTIEFPSVQAKRTEMIVIKNNQSFTIENRLYESPAIRTLEMEKHKFILFSKGKFAAALKLAKNVFAYNENIPFELDIDCTQLELKIKSIEVNLRRCERRNYKNNKDKVRNSSFKTIMPKVINLVKGQPKYSIKDVIQFPILASELNPMAMYKELDEKKDEIKLEKIHLAPSSKGGLLSVDYSLSIKLNFSTKLSTNEKITIPLYFYVPFDINGQKINVNVNNIGLSQPYNGGNQYQQMPNSNIGTGLSQPYNGGNQYQQGLNSNIGLSQPYNGGNQYQQNQNKGTGLNQAYNGGNQYQYNNNYQNYYNSKNNMVTNNINNPQNNIRINQQPLQGNKDLYYQNNKLNNNLNQKQYNTNNINNNYQNVNIPKNIYKDNMRLNQPNNNVYNNYKTPNVNYNLNNKYADNVRIQPTNNVNNRPMNNQLMYNQNIYNQYNNNKPY